jgi:Zn finger protein HypA/HybF involved in hydrogenase expression
MSKVFRCTYCGVPWQVSVSIETPEYSYECPHCRSKRKARIRANVVRADR